jgi:hypothetical protein
MNARLGKKALRGALLLVAASGAAVGLTFVALAAPAPSSAPSASAPSPSASAPPAAKERVAVKDYAWPTSTSPEPTEDEWNNATALAVADPKKPEGFDVFSLSCTVSAVRSWVRFHCTGAPLTYPSAHGPPMHTLGAVWILGGDASTVKGKVPPAVEVTGKPKGEVMQWELYNLQMGAYADFHFEVQPGFALALGVDEMSVDMGYMDVFIGEHPGDVVDVSWAAGEKAPTLGVRAAPR